MKKVLVNLLCAFVPSRQMRHKIRRKLLKASQKAQYINLEEIKSFINRNTEKKDIDGTITPENIF